MEPSKSYAADVSQGSYTARGTAAISTAGPTIRAQVLQWRFHWPPKIEKE